MIIRFVTTTLLLGTVCYSSSLHADVFRWDNGEVIPGTEGIEPGPGVELNLWNTESQNLRFADFRERDLTGAGFVFSWLQDASFHLANLTNTSFRRATLRDADFSDAVIAGAAFNTPGLTQEQLYSTASYKNKELTGLNYTGDLVGWDLREQGLNRANLSTADLTDSNLSGANLTDALLTSATLANARLESADLSRASLSRSNLNSADLTAANLTSASFESAQMTSVNLVRSDLTNAGFRHAVLRDANLADAILKNTSFDRADLRGADLSRVDLRNVSLLDANLTTADLSNTNMRNADLTGAILTASDFSGRDLTRTRLIGATLANADLAGAIVTGADLSGTTINGFTMDQLSSTKNYQQRNLQNIKLSNNDLTNWNLSGQDMTNARLGAFPNIFGAASTLIDADLSNTNLTNGSLRDSNLTGADFSGANLLGADLGGAVGFAPTDSTVLRNAILPNNRIEGLDVREGEVLAIPLLWRPEVSVTETFRVDDHGTLEMYLDPTGGFGGEGVHSQLLSIDPSEVSLKLGGTLRVASIRPDDWPAVRSISLFDWSTPLLPSEGTFSRIELPAGSWDTSDLYDGGGIGLLVAYKGDGDFDVNGTLDARDIDRLSRAAQAGIDLSYDLNDDLFVNDDDRFIWIHSLKDTYFGDANLDGEFNSADLIAVFQAGGYELDVDAGWAEGDWNGDAKFDTADLTVAFVDGGYEQGPRLDTQAVPEPESLLIILLSVLAFISLQNSRRKTVIQVRDNVVPAYNLIRLSAGDAGLKATAMRPST